MAGNSYGRCFCITTFGESHGKAIGVVIDGIESGFPLDEEGVQRQLDRRRPGQSPLTTSREESDRIEILSGMYMGLTTGQPLAMMIRNQDQRSSDYAALEQVYRPGHANYTYHKKWGIQDPRGGGRASARETAARVAAGAVAMQLLQRRGIRVQAYVLQIGALKAKKINREWIDYWDDGSPNRVRCPDPQLAPEMETLILHLKEEGDSIGGVIECCIEGLPPGIGEPIFDRLEAELAKGFMSIPATKGVEFGAGFDAVGWRGSAYRDPILLPEQEQERGSNHAGGVLGGISNGKAVVSRVLFKPPSSIKVPISTLDYQQKELVLEHSGRHDPCVLPRAVVIVEAMAALTLIDLIYRHQARLCTS
jgi:chorismate synthase